MRLRCRHHRWSNSWRRGWDSNPRGGSHRQVDFESTPLRPLRYPSARRNGIISETRLRWKAGENRSIPGSKSRYRRRRLMQDGWRIAALILSTAGYVFALILIPRIILERRQPAATVAWVLSIALLPVVGVPLYFLVGGRRIRRHIRAKIETMGASESSVENRIRPEDLPGSVAADCGRVLSMAGAPPPVAGNR